MSIIRQMVVEMNSIDKRKTVLNISIESYLHSCCNFIIEINFFQYN